MQAAQDDPSLKKEKKVGYSIAGSLSLFIHIGLFLLIGGTVIVEQIIPKQTMTGEVQVSESIVDSPVDDAPEELPQEDVPQPTDITEPQAASSAAEASPFDMNTIVMDSPSPTFSVPTLGVATASPGLPGLGTSPGGSGATGGPVAKKPINIFGAKTESAKLGVVLDCSGSAHSFLVAAFKEIDKNFEDAPTLLVVGCGMAERKDAKVEVYGKIRADKDRDKSGSRTILGQLAMGQSKHKDLERYLDRMKKRNDVWAVNGGDIFGTHYAFEHLIKEGVDTIYWFADFQDSLNAKIVDGLIADLKRKGIKVIAHNFSGKPVPAQATKMATETGGQTIAQIPK